MTTITMKTADLTGAVLDYAVVMAEGSVTPGRFCYGTFNRRKANLQTADCIYDIERSGTVRAHSPSTIWELAGPIIEREFISTNHMRGRAEQFRWQALIPGRDKNGLAETRDCYGPTLLMAAMRCYVVSKLGDSVDIPQELMP